LEGILSVLGKLKYLVFVLCLVLFAANHLLSKNSTWLLKKSSFPIGGERQEKASYADIEVSQGKIFVVENNPNNRIFVHNKDGSLNRIIGKKGRKPGEVRFLLELSIRDDEIAVIGDYVFSFFNREGEFLKRFHAFVSVVSFIYVNDKIFVVATNPYRDSLFEVFTPEGKFITEFGRKFKSLNMSSKENWGREMFVYMGKLLTCGKYLYYLNSTFGKILKYTLDGKKLYDFNIIWLFGEEGKEYVEQNERYWIQGDRRAIHRPLFNDAYLLRDKIYVLAYKPATIEEVREKRKQRNVVKVLDNKSFRQIEEFRVNTGDREYLRRFAVEEQDGEPVFYFVVTSEDKPKIVAEYRREK
jgi:hypothetical protein